MHLTDEQVVEKVPHRQWVFILPKRLRIYVRYDRTLLGKLCTLAYESVCEVFATELGDDTAVPGMIAICQSFGDILNFNSHVNAIASDGVFLPSGTFVTMTDIDTAPVVDLWKNRKSLLMLSRACVNGNTAGWLVRLLCSRTSLCFAVSIDTSVHVDKDDTDGLHRIAQYIARSPLSLGRVVALTDGFGWLISSLFHSFLEALWGALKKSNFLGLWAYGLFTLCRSGRNHSKSSLRKWRSFLYRVTWRILVCSITFLFRLRKKVNIFSRTSNKETCGYHIFKDEAGFAIV